MTNTATNKLSNTTAIVIKLVEISAHKPLSSANVGGKQFTAGRGEAAIISRMADKSGIGLEREIKPCELVENFFVGHTGAATLVSGTKNVEAPSHIAFVPVYKGFNEGEQEYSSELHLSGIQSVIKQALEVNITDGVKAKPGDITLRMTNPGTYEGREVSEARKQGLESWLKERGVSVQWQVASADLPQDERNTFNTATPVDYGEFVGKPGDMLVNGSRDLRTQRVTAALKTVGQMLIQAQGVKRLIVPMTIGANLTLAEAAQESGVSVVLAYIGSQPGTWVDNNRERVEALIEGGAQVIGNQQTEWAQGVFSASIEDLAVRVTRGNGKVALMTPENSRGEGKNLASMEGVKNFFPQVANYLNQKLGAGVVEAELASAEGKRVPAPQQVVTAEIPF